MTDRYRNPSSVGMYEIYADPLPLMYTAGSQPNAAWGDRGMETPTSMRSVDASCEAEVLSNRYAAKEG